VTGASRGIGRAIAVRLARNGATVGALARSAPELAELPDLAGAGRIVPLVADVTDDAALEDRVASFVQACGSVELLVNNAGYAAPRTAIVESAIGDWDRTLATCLRAPMVLSRLVLPAMIERSSGCIINIVSTAARNARAGEAAYAAAKHGLLGFTRSLFAEVREHGIKVAALSPGLVDTAFVPQNKRVDRAKFLRPDDIAEVVLQIVRTPAHLCPLETVVEPQQDPTSRTR
jgi:3-oxoacyl-[acyl-carrier protein] reductase